MTVENARYYHSKEFTVLFHHWYESIHPAHRRLKSQDKAVQSLNWTDYSQWRLPFYLFMSLTSRGSKSSFSPFSSVKVILSNQNAWEESYVWVSILFKHFVVYCCQRLLLICCTVTVASIVFYVVNDCEYKINDIVDV